MTLSYKEMEEKISYEIIEKRKELNTLYQTLDEARDYGWVTTFQANTDEETIKTSLEYGRKVGELQGEISQLESFLNFLYQKEFNKT